MCLREAMQPSLPIPVPRQTSFTITNKRLVGIFGGILGLVSLGMPWVVLTVGIFQSGSPPSSVELSPFDFARSFAAGSSGSASTGNADLDQAIEMISTNVFMTLAGVFILLVGSVASLVYAKVGAPVMLTGWMVSLFGLHIMNNHVHVGGADLVLGSGYGFVVGLVAAGASFFAGSLADYPTASPTSPARRPPLPTTRNQTGAETPAQTATTWQKPG